MIFSIFLIAIAAANAFDVELGYGVRMDLTSESDPCLINVNVPEEAVGPDCSIEVHINQRAGRDYQVFWKNQANGLTVSNEDILANVEQEPERYKGLCREAGSYSLGVRVDDNLISGGTALLNAVDTVTIVRKTGSNYIINPARNQRTGKFAVSEGSWVILEFTLENLATPHMDIDKDIGSKADNLDYFYAPKGVDITVASDQREELSADLTLDVFRKDLPVGDHQFGIFVRSANPRSVSYFDVAFELNADAGIATQFPEFQCPKAQCTGAELQSCSECTKNNCEWCESTLQCVSVGATCEEGFVLDGDECVDPSFNCLAIADCTTCALDSQCVWCEKAVGSGGVCTSGKDNLAQECGGLGSVFEVSINNKTECPAVETCGQHRSCQFCTDEADDSCSWCNASKTCKPSTDVCPDIEEEVLDEVAQCELCSGEDDPNCKCNDEALQQSCTACTNSGCIYCVGVTGTGECTAGRDGLGLECLNQIERKRQTCLECDDPSARTCPGFTGSTTTIIASISAIIIASIAMF